MAATIITGGLGGIGIETARLLLADSPDRSVALVDESNSGLPADFEPHGRTQVFQCDVTDEASVARTAAVIRARMGEVDSLVNGAGIVQHEDSIDLPIAAFKHLMAVHVDGTLLWSQELARELDGPGSIVNIGSIAGQFGHPRRAAYGAAKAAVHSLSKSLAVEWAPRGIRVNAVAPGYTETPMLREAVAAGLADLRAIEGWTAMKRLGTAAEIAAAIVFLLSPQASYITGHVLNVDGGFAALKTE